MTVFDSKQIELLRNGLVTVIENDPEIMKGDIGGLASIRSDVKFAKLIDSVASELRDRGYSDHMDGFIHTTSAIMAYAPILAHTWKGVATMGERAVRTYLRSNPPKHIDGPTEPVGEPEPEPEPEPVGEPEPTEEEPVEEPVEEPEDDDTPDDYMKPAEYEEVFALISMGFNVFLYGPPGTGKTTMLEHISMKLRGDYELLGCIKDACMDITGYVDANGQFTTTPVVRAMEKGVPLILDEVDTGNPDEIGAMNSVASHGEVTPKGRERIRAKKGFCIMASGNTNGRGGDFRYPNAVKMNDAFLDRFEFVYVGYDRRIDLAVALGDEKLVDFINEWRDVCISKGLPTFCPSYRVEGAIAKQVKAGMDLEAVLIRSFLAKLNINATQLATILPLMKGRNGYVNTLKTILEKARAGKLVHILGRCN